MRGWRILLAPIDADFLVLDRLQAVDGAEGQGTIGRVLIRRIIRDDPAAGLLPKGHQSVMHGPVRFHYIEREDTLTAEWQADWLSHSRRHQRLRISTLPAVYASLARTQPTSDERDFDKVDKNTLVWCRTWTLADYEYCLRHKRHTPCIIPLIVYWIFLDFCEEFICPHLIRQLNIPNIFRSLKSEVMKISFLFRKAKVHMQSLIFGTVFYVKYL